MTFNLQQLHAFATIVASGSLGRAAEVLHVTQPALSRTIKRLEDQVGAPLFERHSKGMQLTAIGSALLPHATLLQREADHAREEIDAMRGLAKGTIRVGAVASIATLVLPLAVSGVLARWPNLRVEVMEGVWDRLADSLMKHEIDLALSMAVPDTDEITAIADCRWEDTSYVVAALDHPLRGKADLSLADTLDQQWCVPPRGTGPFEHMQHVFAKHGLGMPDIAVETRSITVLKSLVTRAGFLSWMATPMYDTESAAGVFDTLPIPGLVARRTLTAFRRRQGILPSPAVKLLEQLRQLTAVQG
ncbi:LysR family transcriptional regulator [Paraburkholderia sp. 1N]|uniref:LysR family transcriptional regulator n=1 Tax=Paraburkholderia solitsugae TaxID=2675748 RepID=A0ABX2BZL3_9BURK|nr:LysR family transcriptional regulator [Paraburkholderia solitsugae]NPT46280.1 LysR family transcriptional regulator [Paraburkholderia solitsugae]